MQIYVNFVCFTNWYIELNVRKLILNRLRFSFWKLFPLIMYKTSLASHRFILLFFLLLAASCTSDASKETVETPVVEDTFVAAPAFNADSAYQFVATQISFGPRVPDTEASHRAGDYFIARLEAYGASVSTQEFQVTTFDGKTPQLRNIIASLYPEQGRRILLAAHYDSRPFADKDSVRQDEPIEGANDGASGVAVLLEIARVLHESENKPPVGVDIILFDGEDWGNDTAYQDYVPLPEGLESWWCLGSQYWGKNKHNPQYSAFYGILLDMVGGENAKFYREGYSMHFAPKIVQKVWDTAARLGHSDIFIPVNGASITDDHFFVNRYTNIPMIDIIPTDPATETFGDFHHTHADDLSNISQETLKAVGETVLHVLYNER